MKLKTLKDIDCNLDTYGVLDLKDDLKQEAIKWYKHLDSNIDRKKRYKELKLSHNSYKNIKNNNDKKLLSNRDKALAGENVNRNLGMMHWIYIFFDLTKEDIK